MLLAVKYCPEESIQSRQTRSIREFRNLDKVEKCERYRLSTQLFSVYISFWPVAGEWRTALFRKLIIILQMNKHGRFREACRWTEYKHVFLFIQGLSSQLSGLQIDIIQPPEQLQTSLKYRCVPYLVQFYTYSKPSVEHISGDRLFLCLIGEMPYSHSSYVHKK